MRTTQPTLTCAQPMLHPYLGLPRIRRTRPITALCAQPDYRGSAEPGLPGLRVGVGLFIAKSKRSSIQSTPRTTTSCYTSAVRTDHRYEPVGTRTLRVGTFRPAVTPAGSPVQVRRFNDSHLQLTQPSVLPLYGQCYLFIARVYRRQDYPVTGIARRVSD
jgi:hypothetical protein